MPKDPRLKAQDTAMNLKSHIKFHNGLNNDQIHSLNPLAQAGLDQINHQFETGVISGNTQRDTDGEKASISSRESFTKDISKVFTECFDLINRKNHDYTILVDDPFHNFHQPELEHYLRLNKASKVDAVTIGLLVRFNDKKRRLENLLYSSSKPHVLDESLQDTIKDAMNYLAILLVWRRWTTYDEPVDVSEEVQKLYAEMNRLSEYAIQVEGLSERVKFLTEQNEILTSQLGKKK